MFGIKSALQRLERKIRTRSRVYPPIEPFHTQYLSLGDGHEMYVERCGNPDGIPVVFLHGGPGAGCNGYNRRFFDPRRYHIVLFDQRGAGRSRPYASLEKNTTQQLVSDMEILREALGIGKWLLFGGSWGSTLALVYAQTFPERSLGLILRGIFLCRSREIDWFYAEGANRIFPEHWEDLISLVPDGDSTRVLSSYYGMLTGPDEDLRLKAALAWSVWEGRTSALRHSPSQVSYFADPKVAVALATIECHYFMNKGFLADDQIIRDAPRLAHIPGTIIHGRYDMICPADGAWELHRAWPGSELKFIDDAGHSAAETGIANALVTATDTFAREHEAMNVPAGSAHQS